MSWKPYQLTQDELGGNEATVNEFEVELWRIRLQWMWNIYWPLTLYEQQLKKSINFIRRSDSTGRSHVRIACRRRISLSRHDILVHSMRC